METPTYTQPTQEQQYEKNAKICDMTAEKLQELKEFHKGTINPDKLPHASNH
jgi:hypothetical protein